MSRDYIDNPQEDIAFSLRRIATALETIVEAIDDHAVQHDAEPYVRPEGGIPFNPPSGPGKVTHG